MADVNNTLPLIEPLINSVVNLVRIVKYLLGGVVGIYLINIGVNFYRIRKMNKIIEELRKEIKSINLRLGKIEKIKNK